MVRCIARPHLGLAEQGQVVAVADTPNGGLGFGGPRAEDVAAGSAAARATAAQAVGPHAIHPALDSEVTRLPQSNVREMFISCVKLRGREPFEDIEPAMEQVSEMRTRRQMRKI